MTFGEQLYLGLVVAAFVIFGITLAIVASSTSRFMRRKDSDSARLSRAG